MKRYLKLENIKVKYIESNELSHLSLSLLEGLFLDAPEVRRYGVLDDLHTFKINPIDDPTTTGKKTSHTAQDHVHSECFSVRRCSSRP